MRRHFLLVLALTLSVFLSPVPMQAQVLPGDGECFACQDLGNGGAECVLTGAGSGSCGYIYVEPHVTCLIGGGLCGWDAISMSGQVVVNPDVLDRQVFSGHETPSDGLAMVTSTPLKYDRAIGAYRRVCDGALVATAALETRPGRTRDLSRIRIG